MICGIVVAACGSAPRAHAPAMAELDVAMRDAPAAVVVRESDDEDTAAPIAADLRARLAAIGCQPGSNAVTAGGATIVRAFCNGRGGAVPSELVRLAPAGEVARVALPITGAAVLTAVDGPRPLVVAVLDDVGTQVFDARTLDGLAGWQRMGGWFNAITHGAAASADGAWLAVPDPYGARVDFVRTRDLAYVGSIAIPRVHDRGPGRVAWTAAGLEVTTYVLPYE